MLKPHITSLKQAPTGEDYLKGVAFGDMEYRAGLDQYMNNLPVSQVGMLGAEKRGNLSDTLNVITRKGQRIFYRGGKGRDMYGNQLRGEFVPSSSEIFVNSLDMVDRNLPPITDMNSFSGELGRTQTKDAGSGVMAHELGHSGVNTLRESGLLSDKLQKYLDTGRNEERLVQLMHGVQYRQSGPDDFLGYQSHLDSMGYIPPRAVFVDSIIKKTVSPELTGWEKTHLEMLNELTTAAEGHLASQKGFSPVERDPSRYTAPPSEKESGGIMSLLKGFFKKEDPPLDTTELPRNFGKGGAISGLSRRKSREEDKYQQMQPYVDQPTPVRRPPVVVPTPVRRPVVDKFKKVFNQPVTKDMAIGQLFGDTELGMDFLNKSKWNPSMQAGLRGSRPMTGEGGYIKYQPITDVSASGRFSPGKRYDSPLTASQIAGLQTLGEPNRGTIEIDPRFSKENQLLHKGNSELTAMNRDSRVYADQRYIGGDNKGRPIYLDEAPLRQIGDPMLNFDYPNYPLMSPEYDTEHNYVQSVTNAAIKKNSPDAKLREMQRVSEYYLPADTINLALELILREVGPEVAAEFSNKIFQNKELPLYTEKEPIDFYDGLTPEKIDQAYDIVNSLMGGSLEAQDYGSAASRNAEFMNKANAFAHRFGKGGAISRRDQRKASGIAALQAGKYEEMQPYVARPTPVRRPRSITPFTGIDDEAKNNIMVAISDIDEADNRILKNRGRMQNRVQLPPRPGYEEGYIDTEYRAPPPRSYFDKAVGYLNLGRFTDGISAGKNNEATNQGLSKVADVWGNNPIINYRDKNVLRSAVNYFPKIAGNVLASVPGVLQTGVGGLAALIPGASISTQNKIADELLGYLETTPGYGRTPSLLLNYKNLFKPNVGK